MIKKYIELTEDIEKILQDNLIVYDKITMIVRPLRINKNVDHREYTLNRTHCEKLLISEMAKVLLDVTNIKTKINIEDLTVDIIGDICLCNYKGE